MGLSMRGNVDIDVISYSYWLKENHFHRVVELVIGVSVPRVVELG